MATVQVDFQHMLGRIKPMHAVNNGPTRGSRMFPKTGTFEAFRESGIPFVRNHDASFCANYGGEHTVDINAVFPNFDADPYDPASYDFACTDEYCERIMDAGAEVFYRLGNKIDHRVKKYDSVPPKDYRKWAVICEHIIRHYNYGWADGFYWNIQYWEIWNEPGNGRECWDAPFEEFLPLFAITAKHLKEKFPELKIGGPAFHTGGVDKLTETFLGYMKEHDVPLDFYSWHTYKPEPAAYTKRMLRVREALNAFGYTHTESILNEWNYIINWKDGLLESKKAIIGMKGAAFTAAVMAEGQNHPLDMLMYYDARMGATLNGLFNFYTNERMKGYYPFWLFSKLYRIGQQVKCLSDNEQIYAVAACNEEESAVMLSYFTNDPEAKSEPATLELQHCTHDAFALLLLDDTHDANR
ncbi:MAG: hypothetical protein IJX39_09340 [Clostridia bacterium]|nr:hypothetical protein [Clostridia bacterium]